VINKANDFSIDINSFFNRRCPRRRRRGFVNFGLVSAILLAESFCWTFAKEYLIIHQDIREGLSLTTRYSTYKTVAVLGPLCHGVPENEISHNLVLKVMLK